MLLPSRACSPGAKRTPGAFAEHRERNDSDRLDDRAGQEE